MFANKFRLSKCHARKKKRIQERENERKYEKDAEESASRPIIQSPVSRSWAQKF